MKELRSMGTTRGQQATAELEALRKKNDANHRVIHDLEDELSRVKAMLEEFKGLLATAEERIVKLTSASAEAEPVVEVVPVEAAPVVEV